MPATPAATCDAPSSSSIRRPVRWVAVPAPAPATREGLACCGLPACDCMSCASSTVASPARARHFCLTWISRLGGGPSDSARPRGSAWPSVGQRRGRSPPAHTASALLLGSAAASVELRPRAQRRVTCFLPEKRSHAESAKQGCRCSGAPCRSARECCARELRRGCAEPAAAHARTAHGARRWRPRAKSTRAVQTSRATDPLSPHGRASTRASCLTRPARMCAGAGWSSPSPQAYSALDAVGAAASQLRRTASLGRPVTPTLDGWGEAPARSPRSSVTAMSSSDASASPPPSLQAECAALRDASLSDGGEMSDNLSLESLREQLRRMQLRLAESDAAASALGHELGACSDQYATTLAHLQNEHVQQMQTLESSLRAEVRGLPVGCSGVQPTARAVVPFFAARSAHPVSGPTRTASKRVHAASRAGRRAPWRGCRPCQPRHLGPANGSPLPAPPFPLAGAGCLRRRRLGAGGCCHGACAPVEPAARLRQGERAASWRCAAEPPRLDGPCHAHSTRRRLGHAVIH